MRLLRAELGRWPVHEPHTPGDTRPNTAAHDPDNPTCPCRFCSARRHGEAVDRQTPATAPRRHAGNLAAEMHRLKVLEDRTTGPVTELAHIATQGARVCEVCGISLAHRRATARTCGAACRKARSRENRDSRGPVGINGRSNRP